MAIWRAEHWKIGEGNAWVWINFDPQLYLIYCGAKDRRFKAVHARTGELLRQLQTDLGPIGQPIGYRGPDGSSN